MTEDVLLSCCDLRKSYGKDAGLVRAVDGVDPDVAAGETLSAAQAAGGVGVAELARGVVVPGQVEEVGQAVVAAG